MTSITVATARYKVPFRGFVPRSYPHYWALPRRAQLRKIPAPTLEGQEEDLLGQVLGKIRSIELTEGDQPTGKVADTSAFEGPNACGLEYQNWMRWRRNEPTLRPALKAQKWHFQEVQNKTVLQKKRKWFKGRA
ncbi:hypothetical protein QOT17_009338 [Balamuthia mandrillaris]